MRGLSIFEDEAGQQDMSDGYYLLTLVVHDQSERIGAHIEEYERQLRAGGLPDIPRAWQHGWSASSPAALPPAGRSVSRRGSTASSRCSRA